jgi:DNA polymerase III epsilon subunit-like protein
MKLVIDTETGGTDPQTHSLLEFSAIEVRGGDTFTRRVKEDPMLVTAGALEVNRLDLSKWSSAVGPCLAAFQFRDWIMARQEHSADQVELIGHNIDFDYRFLERLFHLADLTDEFRRLFSYRKRDTAGIARFLEDVGVLTLKGRKLKDICDTLNVWFPPDKEHTSLGDAQATRLLYERLIGIVQNLGGFRE